MTVTVTQSVCGGLSVANAPEPSVALGVNGFQWNFLGGAVPAGSTFARTSTGTYFDANGLLVTASSGVPRFDHDPVTFQPLGYLSEQQSTNANLHSQDMTGATANAITLTNNDAVAPDGTTTMASMLINSATAVHQLIVPTSVSFVTGSVYPCSVFMKNLVGSTWTQFVVAGNQGLNFRPSDGTIGSTLGSATQISARQLANGIWRISFQLTSPFTASTQLGVNFANASNAAAGPSYAGNGTDKIAVWGFQVDSAGVGVTSYIPTTTSTVTRAADSLTMPVTSLPGWNGSTGGVFVAKYRLETVAPVGGPTNQILVALSDGSSNNVIDLRANYLPLQRALGLMVSGGVSQGNPNGSNPTLVPFVRTGLSLGYSTATLYLAANGTFSDRRDGTLSLPVGLTTIAIAPGLNGTLENLGYYAGVHSESFERAVSR